MADVFISYSRKDREFVRTLHSHLSHAKRDDREDIPPSAEWLHEIEQAIEAADTFIFVLSPDSLSSQTCRHECAYANKYNKRIVPVVVRDVVPSDTPEPLRKINWLFFRAKEDFSNSFELLLRPSIRICLGLGLIPDYWFEPANGKQKAKISYLLLAGTDLEEAET